MKAVALYRVLRTYILLLVKSAVLIPAALSYERNKATP